LSLKFLLFDNLWIIFEYFLDAKARTVSLSTVPYPLWTVLSKLMDLYFWIVASTPASSAPLSGERGFDEVLIELREPLNEGFGVYASAAATAAPKSSGASGSCSWENQ
jgi:hypothetical protein